MEVSDKSSNNLPVFPQVNRSFSGRSGKVASAAIAQSNGKAAIPFLAKQAGNRKLFRGRTTILFAFRA
jgi:hypothetical protein